MLEMDDYGNISEVKGDQEQYSLPPWAIGLYIVIEGGGVEHDPKIHGIYETLAQAQKCVKAKLLDFLKEKMFLGEYEESDIVVDKRITDEYTYFSVYLDEFELASGGPENVFAIVEITGAK